MADGTETDAGPQRRAVSTEAAPQRQGMSTAQAFLAVMLVAATAASCVILVTRRRGPSAAMLREQATRVSYRRIVDIGGRGAERFDPVMAGRLSHARHRAWRQRHRKRNGRGRNGAAVAAAGAGCYSLQKESCAPHLGGARASHRSPNGNQSCWHPAADHLDAQQASSICGMRLPRPNPCWMEKGNVSCLPAFFILGEMKCGTTTLYERLSSHPAIVAPVFKEARYLTLPRYRHFTGSWYASNFFPVASSPQAVTFDASPTVFNAPQLAPNWIQKWVPTAKHIVLLRDPVQRTYSHWRMGVEWLRASKCFVTPPMPTNASKANAAEFFRPVPIPEIRMMREVFSFESQARNGMLEVVLRECGANSGWGRFGGDEMVLTNATKACILKQPLGETIAALWKTRQALAGRRTADERSAYAEGMRRISTCSEFMLRPGAGVWRSSRYASNLAAWYAVFPREQIKVVATEEMEQNLNSVLSDILTFLDLPPALLPAATRQRSCVVGKAGIVDEYATANAAWRAGRLDGASDEGGNGGAAIGECGAREQASVKDGVSRYQIDAETEALLRRFFLPFNAKLFALLGRRLPWGEALA